LNFKILKLRSVPVGVSMCKLARGQKPYRFRQRPVCKRIALWKDSSAYSSVGTLVASMLVERSRSQCFLSTTRSIVSRGGKKHLVTRLERHKLKYSMKNSNFSKQLAFCGGTITTLLYTISCHAKDRQNDARQQHGLEDIDSLPQCTLARRRIPHHRR
jgi:hypothetical protein